MATPIITFFSICCDKPIDCRNPKLKSDETHAKDTIILLTTSAFDAVVSISSHVLGILGAFSVIAMPPTAAYALFSVSGVISLGWLGMSVAGVIAVCKNYVKSKSDK